MTTLDLFLPHYDNEVASTRKILECVPDGNFAWKPHDKSMTLGRLASHVADLPNFLKTMVTSIGMELTTSGHKPFTAADPAELLAHFAASAAAARSAMAAAGEDYLAQTWTLTFKGNPVFGGPRTLLLPTTLGHLIHHRGQLTVYLRLNNVKFPGVYGPSADEMSAFA